MRLFSSKGFAILEVILSTALLAGLIYLIMHTISIYRRNDHARAIGTELAFVVSAVLNNDISSQENDTYYLVSNKNECQCASEYSTLLTDISDNYIAGLSSGAFDICCAPVVISSP